MFLGIGASKTLILVVIDAAETLASQNCVCVAALLIGS
jgi:hypothetical protein